MGINPKPAPITLTDEQVGELRRYCDGAVDRMNKLPLLAALFDAECVNLDESACLGLKSILDELSVGQVEVNGTCPLDVFYQKQEVMSW